MKSLLFFVPLALNLVVALVSLTMALTCLQARGFLAFHEPATKTPWAELDPGLQAVFLAGIRLTGAGFLTVFALLAAEIAWSLLSGPGLLSVLAPCVSLVFTVALTGANAALARKTGAPAPWQGSLGASSLLAVSALASAFALA